MLMNFTDLIPEIKTLAQQAGALEMEHYNNGAEVMVKTDGSPVTLADQEAEALILKGLKTLTPDIPVVAEESVAAGTIPDISGGRFWLVDPLDGTKEFVRRTGEFTVNIALMDNFRPVLGVIYTPVTGELYSGSGVYADKTFNGETAQIHVRPVPEDGLTVVASRSHADMDALQDFLQGREVKETVFRGSSLKICKIAEGKADLYPRLVPTSEWDIAAGHAIVNAAGGMLTRLDGSPMPYGKTGEQFENPYFVVHA